MVAPQTNIELALNSIDEFQDLLRQESCIPAFFNLGNLGCRASLADSLRLRVKKPSTVNQAGASLCGPASFFYCLLHDAPHIYVNAVKELYLNGQTNIGQLLIRPSRGCRSQGELKGLNIVDWIALGSLRDSENRLFSFCDPSNSFRGITWPWELAKWFRLAGYQCVTNRARLCPHRSKTHYSIAAALAQDGQRVCMFVDGSSDERPFPIKKIANHWVVLAPPKDSIAEQEVPSIPVFSWGNGAHELNYRRQGWAELVKRYFGCVTASDFHEHP